MMTAQEELVVALGRLVRVHERLRDETLDALIDAVPFHPPGPGLRAELLSLALQVASYENTRRGLEKMLAPSDQQASLEVLG